MKQKKIVMFICTFIVVLSIGIVTQAKYVIEEQNIVAKIDIDRNPPKIELIKIDNTNTGYEKYANKNHTITIQVKIIEEHIIENKMNVENLEIYVGEQMVSAKVEIQEKEKKKDYLIYDIILSDIEEEGELKVKIKQGIIIDKSFNINPEKIIETQIQVDNTNPQGTFSEEEIEEGKVIASILANEKIRKVDGWELKLEDTKLEKEFTNNISYLFTITDLASNSSSVEINISKATNIKITYASHNSAIGWTYGYGNYDVAGGKAVKENPIYKTEALAFQIAGNIPKDFVEINTFIYTHWGEGTKATCGDTGLIYQYGYNPEKGKYQTMNSKDLVILNGQQYLQFGGSSMNGFQKTDINGNNPIDFDTVYQYNYGISGITMRLKDNSYYSIMYQILVNGKGWLQTCSDGEEAMEAFNKPMSAIRVALVPKTEKKYVLESWNKEVGTNHIP